MFVWQPSLPGELFEFNWGGGISKGIDSYYYTRSELQVKVQRGAIEHLVGQICFLSTQ